MTLNITKPIVLVGLMGAGKSTVGKRLADRLSLDFVDIDELIEQAEELKIPEIFEKKGEKYFRKLEGEIIRKELDKEPQVIATGGGAFINSKTRTRIKENATSVWLRADLKILLDRVCRNKNRPLLNNGNKKEILEKLIEERYPIYAEADLVVDSDKGPHYKVVDKIIWKL